MYEDEVYYYSENAIIRIRSKPVKKSKHHPHGVDFAVILTIRKRGRDDFTEVMKIDTSKYHGKVAHAHYFDRAKIKGREPIMNLPEVRDVWTAFELVDKHLRKHYKSYL